MTPEINSQLVFIAPKRGINPHFLLARMTDLSVPFYFEPHYRLPEKVPDNLPNLKLVISTQDTVPSDLPKGVRWLAIPDHYWESDRFAERIPMLADIPIHDAGMNLRLEGIPDEEVLTATLRRMLEYPYTIWNDVLRYYMECLWHYHLLTGDSQAREKALSLAREALADRPEVAENVDYLACLYPLLGMADALPELDIIGYATRVCDDYLTHAPRLRGVLNNFRTSLEAGILRSEVAFQACPPFARLARITRERRFADEAIGQLLLLDKELSDERWGAWHLGCTEKRRTPSLWGRGAVFSLRGVLDTINELPEGQSEKAILSRIADRMVKSFVNFQTEEGLWRQVLDEPATRPEISASCWAVNALALAVEMKIGGGEVRAAVQKGWLALKRKSWDGLPVSVCAATTTSFDPDYFRYSIFAPASNGHFLASTALQILKLNKR